MCSILLEAIPCGLSNSLLFVCFVFIWLLQLVPPPPPTVQLLLVNNFVCKQWIRWLFVFNICLNISLPIDLPVFFFFHILLFLLLLCVCVCVSSPFLLDGSFYCWLKFLLIVLHNISHCWMVVAIFSSAAAFFCYWIFCIETSFCWTLLFACALCAMCVRACVHAWHVQ